MTPQRLLSPTIDGLCLPWTWCIRCRRAYPSGTYRIIHVTPNAWHPYPRPLHLCPYTECSGTSQDGWCWATILRTHPEYPATPTVGVRYGSAVMPKAPEHRRLPNWEDDGGSVMTSNHHWLSNTR